jgi:hypothetical protein
MIGVIEKPQCPAGICGFFVFYGYPSTTLENPRALY